MPSNQSHRVEKLVGDCEDWHVIGVGDAPDFENSWDNVGGIESTAAFYKDPFGTVHLKGALDTGATGSVAFTLPTGYRPSTSLRFLLFQETAAAGARALISTNGEVNLQYTTSAVHLTNVSFRV